MKIRRVSLIAALATCAALLSGCVGEPAPVETTPLFASEDEAFAAAEATYRAYVDALNQAATGETTWAGADSYLVGAAFEQELESRNSLAVSGQRLTGVIKVQSFNGKSLEKNEESVIGQACIDVSGTRVLNASDQDVTDVTRDLVIPVELTFVADSESLVIAKSIGYPEGMTC